MTLTELKDNKALEMERIYMLSEFHGKSIGQLLYDKSIQIAKQKNADYVWLVFGRKTTEL
jgi:diamine N-acetyltransferase